LKNHQGFHQLNQLRQKIFINIIKKKKISNLYIFMKFIIKTYYKCSKEESSNIFELKGFLSIFSLKRLLNNINIYILLNKGWLTLEFIINSLLLLFLLTFTIL